MVETRRASRGVPSNNAKRQHSTRREIATCAVTEEVIRPRCSFATRVPSCVDWSAAVRSSDKNTNQQLVVEYSATLLAEAPKPFNLSTARRFYFVAALVEGDFGVDGRSLSSRSNRSVSVSNGNSRCCADESFSEDFKCYKF